jgi:crotonobetainyl-CoA hydratase
MEEARGLARSIVSAAPLAVGALLEVTREVEALSDEQAFARLYSGLPARERMRKSDDFNEGPRAFAEKRPPRWTGK